MVTVQLDADSKKTWTILLYLHGEDYTRVLILKCYRLISSDNYTRMVIAKMFIEKALVASSSRYVVTVSTKAQFLTRLQKFERRRQAFHFN